MTKGIAEKIVKGITDKIECNTAFCGFTIEEYEEFLDKAIKAQEQQPCETIKEIPKDYKYDTETEDFIVYRHIYTGHEIHIERPVPRYRLEQQPIEKCKWIRYDYRTVCPQNHGIDNPFWRIPENRMDTLKYCPYCGREIEVTE